MDTAQAMRTVSESSRDRVKVVDTVHNRPQQVPAQGAVSSSSSSISSSGRHSSSSSSSSRRDGEGWQLKVRGYQQTPELIEQLPPLTGQAFDLVVVDLAGNRLASLPLNLHQLTRLTALDLGHNQLTAAAVGPTMSRLVHLKHLSLRTNRLETLPASLLRLTGLETLDVSHNPLDWDSLTVILGKLTSLKVLRASACGCEELPEEVCALSRLEQLHLSSNRLQALPQGVAYMPVLEVVNLAGNHLHHFTQHGSAGMAAPWPRLRSLDLSDQYVGLLHASGLTECTALEVLRLGGNAMRVSVM
jgi:Leucine-rich repeat (LRR) protein